MVTPLKNLSWMTEFILPFKSNFQKIGHVTSLINELLFHEIRFFYIRGTDSI